MISAPPAPPASCSSKILLGILGWNVEIRRGAVAFQFEGIGLGQTEEKSDQGCEEEASIRFYMPCLWRRGHPREIAGRIRARNCSVWRVRVETRVHGDSVKSDRGHILHVHGRLLRQR